MKKIVLLLIFSLFLACNDINGDNGGSPVIYTPPADWEDAAYLFRYPDVAGDSYYGSNPLEHYIRTGQAEGRVYKPEGWSSAQYLINNPDVAAAGVAPLLHYWQFGKAEGRSYLPPSLGWMPPQTPGLHCIIKRQADKRQFFSGIRVPGGLILGDYGLNVGGASVRLWNGKFTPDGQFPESESVFDFYLPSDGQMLLTNEHYATIRKRTSSGWVKKYGRQAQTDLMFYIRKAGQSLYGNWMSFDKASGGVVSSDLTGNVWNEIVTYTGKVFPGMTSDGNAPYLAGKTGDYRGEGYPILADFRGNILSSRSDRPKNLYWGVAKHGSVWVMGTCNGHLIPSAQGEIHLFDGSTNRTVWSNERNVIHSIENYNGKLYAVATWTWTVEGKTSLLLTSPDGYNWSVVSEIPCASIFGTRIQDGGIYMFGGKYESFGSVYFYKF